MDHKVNPYNWSGDRPRHVVPRETLRNKVVDHIERGQSGYLIGCRGMGKSAFLHQVERALQVSRYDLLAFPTHSLQKNVQGAVQAIADAMERVSQRRAPTSSFIGELQRCAQQQQLDRLFDVYLDAAPAEIERLVLLYDELDTYAEPEDFGKIFFNVLEGIRKKSDGRIVVFAAGGLDLVAIDSLLGSSFFSRLTPSVLEPFDLDELTRLAEPFAKRGAPLSSEVLETLRLSTGGNLGMATYGLQRLWGIDSPTIHDVTRIFGEFRDEGAVFLDKIRRPIFDKAISEVPELVWRELKSSGGRMTSAQLKEIANQIEIAKRINPKHIFDMLRSTGLIRASDDAWRQTEIKVELISSILTLDVPEEPNRKDSIREQLVADLCDVLASIHRMAPDFYRGEKGKEKEILPEAVFSAALVLGLEPRGWKTEREAQSAAGRTDIKARHERFGERYVVVEVKLWNRNDYAKIHDQVVGYWSEGVEALATVMVTDQQAAKWPATYAKKCLKDNGLTHQSKDPPPALAGHFVARAQGCKVVEVDHFLLRLAKRS